MKFSMVMVMILIMYGCTPAQPINNSIKDIYKYSIPIDFEMKHVAEQNNFPLTTENSNEVSYPTHKNTFEQPPIVGVALGKENYSKNLDINDDGKVVRLSVDDIPLSKFTKLVFGQILKKNFTMDDGVEKSNKRVTLNLSTPISKEELLTVVKKIYENNGFYIEQEGSNYFIKSGRAQAQTSDLGTNFFYGSQLPNKLSDNAVVTIFIPYYYVHMNTMEPILKNYLSKGSFSKNMRKKHIFIVRDRVKNLRNLLRLVRTVDVPVMKSKHTSLMTFDYIDVNDFHKNMKQVLPSSGLQIADNVEKLGVIIEPIEGLNALFVVADKLEWIDIIKYWKRKLDVIDVNNDSKKVFVYRPKNRIASELKELIEGLFNNGNSQKRKSLPLKSENNDGDDKPTNDTTNKITNKNVSFLSSGDGDDIKVIEDSNRNALVIYTTSKKYKQLLDMLEKLDVLPKQVLIEVTIAELTLKDSLKNGFEWWYKHKSSNSNSIVGTLGGLGLGGTGLMASLVNADKFTMAMNFFAQKNLVNILSSPKIVVMDNQAASINVGTEVPVLTSSSTTTSASSTDQQLSQSVEYRQTGIILNVTPTIHSGDSLMLQISQVVSDAQENDVSAISSPMILTRDISTSVVLNSEQTMMLGGLIRENKSITDTKVPILGDIPFIKHLFSSSSDSINKTELIILIKPTILNSKEESSSITNSFKNLLSHHTAE